MEGNHMELQDLKSYAEDALAEEVTNNISGFVDVSDATSRIEDLESDFDGDSYCPYYIQQDEVISRYERDFGSEAEDICDGGTTYKASEYQQAQTAYAYAIAYCGFSSYFAEAKQELIDALEEFETDAERELHTDTLDMDDVVRVRLTGQCPHGWAAHDRELEDGTMVWESGQLDGCNGMARQVVGVWVSCCLSAKEKAEESEAR
jgi:hypothetical protein